MGSYEEALQWLQCVGLDEAPNRELSELHGRWWYLYRTTSAAPRLLARVNPSVGKIEIYPEAPDASLCHTAR